MQDKKQNQNKYKYKDIINVEEELLKRKQLIDIALQPSDNSWTEMHSYDNIQTSYKKIGNEPVNTVRCITAATWDAAVIDDWYKHKKCGYNDIYTKTLAKDKSLSKYKILKLIDNDHEIMYQSHKTKNDLMDGRDFTSSFFRGNHISDLIVMKTRFKYFNYDVGNIIKQYKNVVGCLEYSLKPNHPFYLKPKDNHTRATIIRRGIVFSYDSNNDNNTIHIACVSSYNHYQRGGSIYPQWLINALVGSDTLRFEAFRITKNYLVQQLSQKNTIANRSKQDHTPLFTQTHKKLRYTDPDDLINDNQKLLKWKCVKCTMINEIYVDKCICCFASKPVIPNNSILFPMNDDNKNDLNDDNIHGNIIDTNGNNNGIQINNNINQNNNVLSPQESIEKEFYNILKEINMEKYFNKFKENDCCDMESIKYFDDDTLKNEINIQSIIARKRFLGYCSKLKIEMNEFINNYGLSSLLQKRLAKYGIVTLNILCNQVKSKHDLMCKYQITNKNQIQFLWQIIQKNENLKSI